MTKPWRTGESFLETFVELQSCSDCSLNLCLTHLDDQCSEMSLAFHLEIDPLSNAAVKDSHHEMAYCQAVVNMVFVTTSSNTGHLTAIYVAIQQWLARLALWSGYRHHIGEVILKQTFDALKIEASKSPEVSLFVRFRENFNTLEHGFAAARRLSRADVAADRSGDLMLAACAEHVFVLATEKLDFCRDDYKEFAQLCIVFLLGTSNNHIVKFQRPGALHKARWMANLIYGLKIAMLHVQEQIDTLPPGTITTRQQTAKLRTFVVFDARVYSAWWFTCTSATDAAWHDLVFLN